MTLNSTKFGGNRTKDVEVGPDRWTRWTDGQTDRQIGRFLYTPQTMFAGTITRRGQPTRSIGVILNEGQGLRKQILEEDYPKSITADR